MRKRKCHWHEIEFIILLRILIKQVIMRLVNGIVMVSQSQQIHYTRIEITQLVNFFFRVNSQPILASMSNSCHVSIIPNIALYQTRTQNWHWPGVKHAQIRRLNPHFLQTITNHQAVSPTPFSPGRQKALYPKKKENKKPKEEKERDIYYKNRRRAIYFSRASGWWAKHGAPEHSERSPKRTVPSPRRCGSSASGSLAPRFSAHPRRLAGTPQSTFCLSDSTISAGIGSLWTRFVRRTLCLINLCEIREVFVVNLVLFYCFTDQVGFEKFTGVFSICFWKPMRVCFECVSCGVHFWNLSSGSLHFLHWILYIACVWGLFLLYVRQGNRRILFLGTEKMWRNGQVWILEFILITARSSCCALEFNHNMIGWLEKKNGEG